MKSKAEISIKEAKKILVDYDNLNQARDFKGIDGARKEMNHLQLKIGGGSLVLLLRMKC